MMTTISATASVDPEAWGPIARTAGFYSSAAWLRFSDSDGVATASYLTAAIGQDVRALLPAYWSPNENNPWYQSPASDSLILGGRRGYLSTPLIATSADAPLLGELVSFAMERAPQVAGRWWWPYLLGDDAQLVASVFGFGEDHISLSGADAVIDVPPGGVAEHIDRLTSKQRRTNARREMRRIEESGLYIDEAPLGDQAVVLGPLLAQVQQRYGHDHGPEQMTALLERQADYLQDASIVFRCRRQSDNAIVGFSLAYRHGDELAIRVVGFDYAAVENTGAYASLSVYAPVEYCVRNNLSTLHLGMESLDAKSRRGARIRPLWEVGTHRYPAARRMELAASIGDQLPTPEREAFLRAARAG